MTVTESKSKSEEQDAMSAEAEAEETEVEYGENASDTATLLLAAAEELGLDAGVVRTAEGKFVVPKDVNDKAFPTKRGAKSAPSDKDK